MKGKQKGIYQPPTSAVVEMKTQGMLCWSNEVYSSIWFMNGVNHEEVSWGRDGYGPGEGADW